VAFKPSKRPSSPATRREQRKASGNAALAAGRYQGIPSYNDEPDPVPVTLPTRGSSGLTSEPLGGDPFAPISGSRGYIPYREPTLKPTINSYGQQLLNTNPVNRVTRKGIASLANVWTDNPLIDYDPSNSGSLLRNIVNYVPNVATNLFKSIPGAATAFTGVIPDILLGRGVSEKTRAGIAGTLGTELMSYLESTMGSGFGSRLFLNANNLNRYAKPLKGSLDKSKGTVGGGGGLSAPTVRTLKPDEKMARDILDRGSDITTSEVQILNKINPSSKKFIDEDYERSLIVGDPMASRSPLQRDLLRELRVREEIAKILNLDRSHPAVIERAQSIIGRKPITVFHGRASDTPRLEGRPNQYTSTNPAVAKTYADLDTFFGYKKPEEFFFMADPNKGGVRIDARGATWNKIPGNADVRYQGGLNSLDEYTGSTWMQSTDEAYNALRKLKPKPNSIQMENIIDPKSLLTQNSFKYLGDNYVTTNPYSLRYKDALMLPQFKKLPGYAYRGGGIVSLLK